MSTDVTNTLIANITSTEQSTGNVDINRSVGNPSFSSAVGSFTTYFSLAAGANVIPLPLSPCTQVYIRNLDNTKTVAVSWTPNGGALEPICVLNPGGVLLLWDNPAGPTTPGITSVSMTPSAATCLVEYFFGG